MTAVATCSPVVERVFRVAAVAEACSWVGLLIGMAVKYVGNGSEAGVHLFGPIHGGIFVFYVLATLVCARARRWSTVTTLVALAASIPPLATIAFERWATRTLHLSSAAT